MAGVLGLSLGKDPDLSKNINEWIASRRNITSFPALENIMFKKPAQAAVNMVLGTPEQRKEFQNLGNQFTQDPEAFSKNPALKKLAMETGIAMGLTGPVARPGMFRNLSISQQSALNIPKSEMELVARTRTSGGITKSQAKEFFKQGYTMGDVQNADLRAKGLGLLADFDNANKAGNPQLQRMIGEKIMQSGNPYTEQIKQSIFRLLQQIK